MKLQRFTIGLVPAWMLAMPFTLHAPTTALELRTYKKASSAELADVRERALRLAATGSALEISVISEMSSSSLLSQTP